MVTIQEYLAGNIKIRSREEMVDLDTDAQRELIVWLWKNRSDMIRDVVCEHCPEHLG